jgi:hypothetical protein
MQRPPAQYSYGPHVLPQEPQCAQSLEKSVTHEEYPPLAGSASQNVPPLMHVPYTHSPSMQRSPLLHA